MSPPRRWIPISTSKIEELALELKKDYTIVMVTHNMQQATRISDRTAFFLLGEVVEFETTVRTSCFPCRGTSVRRITLRGGLVDMATRFELQLEDLHVQLITMGSLCEKAISLSAQAVQGQAEDYAPQVLTDKIIDSKEREIENHCMSLLLHHHPVARDLREISAALKMVSDMERIGDQAADIPDLSVYIEKTFADTMPGIGRMAEITVRMVTESVDAFVKSDLELCRKVINDDDLVDDEFNQVKDKLAELIYGGNLEARTGLDLLMTAKYFERIGDHAVNIAESVEYSITGEHRSNEHHSI